MLRRLMSVQDYFATGPRGMEDLLVQELLSLGCQDVHAGSGGARFTASLSSAYRVAMWSRLAGRLLRTLATLRAPDPDALYESGRAVSWPEIFGGARSFAISVGLAKNARIDHSRFALHRLKDAIADHFRDAGYPRPDVDTEKPDIRFDLAIHGDQATLSIDFVGEPVHRRQLRDAHTPAPLRENLAAALYQRCHARGDGFAFLDPMCGGGTLALEAAMSRCDVAPGLLRRRWAFSTTPEFDAGAWQAVVDDAQERKRVGVSAAVELDLPIVARDVDRRAVASAHEASVIAGLDSVIRFESGPVSGARPSTKQGLLLTNPPWGRRLAPQHLEGIYRELGDTLVEHFDGWEAAVLVGEAAHGRWLGLHAAKRHKVHNGAVACQLLRVDVTRAKERTAARGELPERKAPEEMVNRLRKNLKQRRKYAKRVGTEAYRVYDADLPEYAVAVDVYGEQLHVAEYAPPKTIDPQKAQVRLHGALAAVREVFEVDKSKVALKRRQRQKGSAQYEAQDEEKRQETFTVREGPAELIVNLHDYLDTGLFLDHRPTRLRLAQLAHGKRFLNLFCYTATASVHAALGGARETLSLDMSATYLEWAERNFERNRLDARANRLERVDVLAWLESAAHARYDLIFCDPPTFSNSKKMAKHFDVQEDHSDLIRKCMRTLAPGGLLIFSTNNQRFKMDTAIEDEFEVKDISRASIPDDFVRKGRRAIHACFELRAREP
jgi:23S rRNA (guanine2445-N2)-methyltransferase / 23S rRNA (guanine2069-N7)-methyltransferase